MDAGTIQSLYQQYLGRSPEEGAYSAWGGADYNTLLQGILGSQEYANRQGASQPQPAPQPAPAYTQQPVYGDYNFEMTGRPSDQELITNPDVANAWYRYSGESAPAPVTNWENAPDWTKNTPKAVSFYQDYGFEAPFNKADLTKAVDPNSIRLGYNNTPYAPIASNNPNLPSGGEYVVNPQTGKFILDAKGNPIPVPQKPNNPSDMGDVMSNYIIPGAIALGSIPVLGGLAGQALGGLGGLGSAGFDTWGMSPELLAELGLEGTTSGLSGVGAAGDVLSGLGIEGAYDTWGMSPELLAELGLAGSTSGLTDLSGEAGSAMLEQMGLNTSSGLSKFLGSIGSSLGGLGGSLGTLGLAGSALKGLTGGTTPTATAGTAGTPSTYAPRGQVGYDPLLNLLAPKMIARNPNSLLG